MENLPPQVKTDFAKIESVALHVREIIHKLLAFAMQTHPRISTANLNEIIQETSALYQARCIKDSIELNLALAPALLLIIAYHGQIKQVLINLIIKAMQAMPHRGTLTVATHSSADSVFLAVEDTGIGIAHDAIKNLNGKSFPQKSAAKPKYRLKIRKLFQRTL